MTYKISVKTKGNTLIMTRSCNVYNWITRYSLNANKNNKLKWKEEHCYETKIKIPKEFSSIKTVNFRKIYIPEIKENINMFNNLSVMPLKSSFSVSKRRMIVMTSDYFTVPTRRHYTVELHAREFRDHLTSALKIVKNNFLTKIKVK